MSDPPRDQPPLASAFWARARVQALAVLLVCAAVYWPGLGWAGLAYTEGHRAVPGFELLHRVRAGDLSPTSLLVTTLFEQPYMRKPPGMPWAIALAASVLGENELAPRAVSALASTLAALLSLWAARCWFGAPWGLVAGLAHALTPLFWQVGRSGEIEALNNLCTQAAVLGLIGVAAHRAARAAALPAAAAALGVLGLAWAKGPASLPCVVAGAAAGLWLAPRAARPRAAALILAAVILPLLAAGAAWLAALRLADALERPPITQGIGEFLWSLDRAPRIATLPLVAFASALPLALVLLWPWGPDARREAPADDPDAHHTLRLARALAAAGIASLLAYAALGASNPRYAMPAFTFIAPLAAYLARGRAGAFLPHRARLAGLTLLGRGPALLAVLLLAAAVVVPLTERSRARNSGRTAGAQLASLLPAYATVHADLAVEARPEMLWYASRRAPLRVVWSPRWALTPPSGAFALLLAEPTDEHIRIEPTAWSLGSPTGELHVAGFVFQLRPVSANLHQVPQIDNQR
jgi:4-amino-4-deoxy-L-arabinose transferase-like glycosyltransferase